MLFTFFLRIKNNTKLADVETTNFSIKLFICKHLGSSFLTFFCLCWKGRTTNFLVIHFKSTFFRIRFQLNLNLTTRHYGGKYFLTLKIRSNIYDYKTQNGLMQILYVQNTQPVNLSWTQLIKYSNHTISRIKSSLKGLIWCNTLTKIF